MDFKAALDLEMLAADKHANEWEKKADTEVDIFFLTNQRSRFLLWFCHFSYRLKQNITSTFLMSNQINISFLSKILPLYLLFFYAF